MKAAITRLIAKFLALDPRCAKCHHFRRAHVRDLWWLEDFCRACPDHAIGHKFKEKEA